MSYRDGMSFAWENGRILKSISTGEPNIRRLNPFRYRGYVYDNETGLYYLQSRYYDPITGRFLNADDIRVTFLSTFLDNDFEINITNIFTYCYNNQIKYCDYNGYIAAVDDAVVLTLIGLFFITCTLCVFMSTPQFKQAWVNFCNAVGNGLASIWYTICDTVSSVWNWSASKIKNATNAVKKFNTVTKADNKIKNTVKKKSKTRYWSATLKSGYVIIGESLSYSKAKEYVKKGHQDIIGIIMYMEGRIKHMCGICLNRSEFEC